MTVNLTKTFYGILLAVVALIAFCPIASAQDFSEYEDYVMDNTVEQISDSKKNSEEDNRAQIVKDIEAGGRISVNIPDGLNSVLTYNESGSKEAEQSDNNEQAAKNNVHVGYRVQVFDDNNVRTAKTQAQERKRMIESRFPEFRTYVQFNSPYWRVKVGDFRTRSEAEAAMGAIKASFPNISSQLRVVRDKINPR